MPGTNRIAVDIGGTFTDVVLDRDGNASSLKLLTTHEAPERAALEGIATILAGSGLPASELGLVIHGTTLATNALIERKGARTALLTTKGFRDSIEIAYEHRFEQYDLYMERPIPLVERDLRLEVPERRAADGSVLLALDEDAVRALVPVLREHRIQSVAICFLHAYVDAAHEERTRAILTEAMPELAISISAEVCREIREYERASTTVANAYVLPLMASYLARMQDGLRSIGAGCPLLLMMSSGGITTVQTATRFPVRLVESGPAGGAILARHVAARNGLRRAIAFDMGGTTAKITLIDDYTPQQSRRFEIARAYRFVRGSGIPVHIPVIDMVEIGAGGGSIARVDKLRRIVVGPDSAGSEPGPACYGRGGMQPTVTDADVVLGRIEPAGFAGGKMALDGAAARTAIMATVGDILALTVEEAARGIAEIVGETMASAARVHAVENGKDTSGRTLIAFGGAAPLHAARLAQKLGIARVVIPADAGVGSAVGFLKAPIAYEVARTLLVRLDQLDAGAVEAMYSVMRDEAEVVVRLGAPTADLKQTRTGFMRYRGQGHEIAVAIQPGPADAAVLRELFDAAYHRLYGRLIPGLEVEAVTWVLSLSENDALPEVQVLPVEADPGSPVGTRRVIDPATGHAAQAVLWERAALRPGARLAGPAVILEDGTSTIVPPGFTAILAAGGELLLEVRP